MNASAHKLGCERLPDCAAYVLGALAEHEVQAHRAHLAECLLCPEEVAQLQLVADSLAVGVPRVVVPESLRARIVGTAHAEAELRDAARQQNGSAVSARAGGPARAGRPARAGGLSTRRLRPALAGVLALGVGLAIGALAFSSETSEKTETIRAIVVAPGRHATAELRKAGS
ncbi:MAG: hypothetical protein ACRDLF_08990, partial [Solirubrobacteraceae bacterium]